MAMDNVTLEPWMQSRVIHPLNPMSSSDKLIYYEIVLGFISCYLVI